MGPPAAESFVLMQSLRLTFSSVTLKVIMMAACDYVIKQQLLLGVKWQINL